MAYTRHRQIGRGQFGIVDLVADDGGINWARKTFAAPDIPNVDPADLRSRFEREVRYQSQVDHPNVVKIQASDLEANPPWFVMELADCSLADELTADRTLGGNPRRPLFDILNGLEAIHKLGYKHRDLKPANVLRFLDENGRTYYAISDFGLMAPESGATSTLTSSNMGGGTPLYRAPECAINFRRATTQSDIYSFGAMLHDIFGGGAQRLPHVELSVSGPLNEIVRKCTRTNVRRRFPNVATLREALYEALSAEELQFVSPQEEELVLLLQSKDELSDEEWDRVFQQIDDNADNGLANHTLFRAIGIPHLYHLADSAPELFASLGSDYAKYAQEGSFDFGYCDVIANKAEVFYQRAELDVKACVAIATLVLGVRHNRWYVERKFLEMTNAAISEELAKRIRAEVEAQHIDFLSLFLALEGTIKASKNDLHPVLQDLLPA